MKEQWVVLQYFEHDPVRVYGTFKSDREAYHYAESQGMAEDGGAYAVHQILNNKED
jgi:hypothetical protein